VTVRIRLRKTGAKKRPMYRIVVADSRAPRDGNKIDVLGFFNPIVNPPEIKLDTIKFDEWVKKGAQPTPTVKALLKQVKKSEKEATEQ